MDGILRTYSRSHQSVLFWLFISHIHSLVISLTNTMHLDLICLSFLLCNSSQKFSRLPLTKFISSSLLKQLLGSIQCCLYSHGCRISSTEHGKLTGGVTVLRRSEFPSHRGHWLPVVSHREARPPSRISSSSMMHRLLDWICAATTAAVSS